MAGTIDTYDPNKFSRPDKLYIVPTDNRIKMNTYCRNLGADSAYCTKIPQSVGRPSLEKAVVTDIIPSYKLSYSIEPDHDEWDTMYEAWDCGRTRPVTDIVCADKFPR